MSHPTSLVGRGIKKSVQGMPPAPCGAGQFPREGSRTSINRGRAVVITIGRAGTPTCSRGVDLRDALLLPSVLVPVVMIALMR